MHVFCALVLLAALFVFKGTVRSHSQDRLGLHQTTLLVHILVYAFWIICCVGWLITFRIYINHEHDNVDFGDDE